MTVSALVPPDRKPVMVPRRTSRASSAVGAAVAVSDVVSPLVVLGTVATVGWWVHLGRRPELATLALFVATAWGTYLVACWFLRLHSFTRRRLAPTAADGLGRAIGAVALGAVLALAFDTLLRARVEPVLPPGYVLVGAAASIAVLPMTRVLALTLFGRRGWRRTRVVIVGTGTIAADVAGRLARARLVEVVGFVDDDPIVGQRVLGDLDDLPAICASAAVDRVVVAFSGTHPARVGASLRRLPGTVAVDVVPRYYELTGWQASVGDLDGLTVLSLGDPPGLVGRATKRAIDVAGAGSALVLLLPVLGAAALVVRVSSSGPVLFRQTRVGRDRRPFEVLKLRTMEVAAPDGSTERRVTPVGRVLRRTGVDEIPQLINVLRGEMSLVGPRPFVPEECRDLPPWAERRFAVRPGVTGLWQVCGQHALRKEELHRLDALYVSAWSIDSDLRILARTPRRLLSGGGDRDAFWHGPTTRSGL